MALESEFQADLIKEIKFLLPGSFVLKNDSAYMQGVPDLLILFRNRWAMLEVKKSENEPYQPNQEWYLEQFNAMSFSATIYPENREIVLDELQHALRSRRAARVS